MRSLVEPDGYLQWDEFDVTTFTAYTPAAVVSKACTDELLQVWQSFAEKLDVRLGYTL